MSENRDRMRRIRADWNVSGIYVYQAFRPATVAAAVTLGTFGPGFGPDRLTWIKPSFGWILHRSEYATAHRQEAIARVHLSHEGFQHILGQSIETVYDPSLFSTCEHWTDTLSRGDVRHQWDPDRDLRGARLEHRALQVGIRGLAIRRYVNEWILGIEDVTPLAREIGQAVRMRRSVLPAVPIEREYPLEPLLARRLGCD